MFHCRHCGLPKIAQVNDPYGYYQCGSFYSGSHTGKIDVQSPGCLEIVRLKAEITELNLKLDFFLKEE
jgi:hypothetical protein